jgi:hypothetical protein
MNWGKGIVISFIFFALFIGVLVTVCVKQEVSLVSKNYYSEELNYQNQIDQLSNYAQLAIKPVVNVRNGVGELNYADLPRIQSGKLDLYRPSDPGMDRSFDILPTTDSTMRFDVSNLQPGKYNVNFTWSMNGREYLSQLVIVL